MDGNGNETSYRYNPINRLETRTDAQGFQESYLYDIEGRICAYADQNGSQILYQYNMYGDLKQRTDSNYLRARYYNPVIGRFIQEDTYYVDGLNLYAYCCNNPVLYYNPMGHETNYNNSRRALEDEVLGRRDYGDSDFAERYSNHRATEDYFAKKEAQKQQGIGGTDGGSNNGKKSNSGKTNGGSGNGSDKLDVSEKKPKASNDGTDSSNNKPKADVQDDKPSQGGRGSRYSGALEQVSKPDPAADALAERINGRSRVKFANDPDGREFDAISDEYIAQAKPALKTVNKSVRNQMKATFEAALANGKKVYYQFEGKPAQRVIDKLREYSKRYGVEVIIDTTPLGVSNK